MNAPVAIIDPVQHDAFVEAVFTRYEAEARAELTAEALTKIDTHVDLSLICEQICEPHRAAFEHAFADDDGLEILRLLRTGRDEIIELRRTTYIEDHIEDRVWELFNKGGL